MSEQNKIDEIKAYVELCEEEGYTFQHLDNLKFLLQEIEQLTDSVEMLQRESRRYAQVGAEVIEERDRLLAEIECKDEALNEIELILTDDTSTQAIEINQVINRAREAL